MLTLIGFAVDPGVYLAKNRETMSTEPPLAGRIVALPESRELDLLAAMFEREGAVALRYPLVNILDATDQEAVGDWIDALIAGEFTDALFYTGEGLRRLLAFAHRRGMRAETIAAFAAARKICRGPKPAKALREIDLAPDLKVEPATTAGIVETLSRLDFSGRRLGIQLFDENVPEPLAEFLKDRGIEHRCVSPYRYAPADDGERVAELIQRLAAGEADVVAFTSAAQTERLWQVAKERDLLPALEAGLRRTLVAAVGPVVERSLEERGVSVSVVPEEKFFMKPLVDAVVRRIRSRDT